MVRQLQRAGYRLVSGEAFPIRYRQRFIDGQINMCRQRVRRFSNPALAHGMLEQIADMERRSYQLLEQHDGLAHGMIM